MASNDFFWRKENGEWVRRKGKGKKRGEWVRNKRKESGEERERDRRAFLVASPNFTHQNN
jgi:hypothetical protein